MSKIAELVKIMNALTKSEKRYITLAVNKQWDNPEKSNPAKLFKILTESDIFTLLDYNQQRLTSEQQDRRIKDWTSDKKNIKDQDLVYTTNIQKLLDFIFDSLRQYYRDQPEFKLERYIQDARVYRDKGFLEEALKLILKIKQKILSKYDSPVKAQEVLFLERQVRLIMRKKDDIEELKKLQVESLNQNNHIEHLCKVFSDRENLTFASILRRREGLRFSEITERVIKDISNSGQYSFDVQMISLHNAVLYYQTIHEAEEGEDRSELAFPYRQKLYQLFEANPNRQEMNRDTYEKVRAVYLNGCYYIERPDLAKDLIVEEEQSLGFKWEGDVLGRFEGTSSEKTFNKINVILAFYIETGKDERVQQILKNVHFLLLNAKTRVSNRFTLFVNFAVASLLIKDNERALEYLENVKKLHNISDRTDYILVEVLEVAVLYQMRRTQNEDLEQKIGELIIRLGKDKASRASSIARTIVSSLYTILTKGMETNTKKKQPQISKTFEAEELTRLLEDLQSKRVKGTVIAFLPLWLQRRIQEAIG